MAVSVLPEPAVAALRAISEAGFRHTAQRYTEVVTRFPNGEEETTLALGPLLPARLTSLGVASAQKAAALGVKAQWGLDFQLQDDVAVGERFRVAGETGSIEWTREVEITADLGLTGRVHRHTTAVDVELNQ